MAQLKSTVVQGSLRVTDTTYTNDLVVGDLTAPTIKNGDYLLIADADNGNKILKGPTFDGSTTTQALTKKGTWATFNNYSHPTGDGNLHVPATGTGNNGKFLKAGSTAGSISWSALPTASTTAAGIVQLDSATGSGETTAVTPKGAAAAATAAVNALDGNLNSTSPGAGKTLTAFSQTNGKVSATFGDISITASQASLGNVSNNANLNGASGAKGDIIYWSAANTPAHLTNTTSTTKHFLSITSQVPAWSTVSKSDVGLGNVTNDAQVKASLGTAKGDILYWSAKSTPARLAIGSNGRFLTVSSGAPAWGVLPTADSSTAGIMTLGASGGAATYEHTHKIDGATGSTITRYGVCYTSALIPDKSVTITNGTFTLETGARVTVKFNNGQNRPLSPMNQSFMTLNVNNTGAKKIKRTNDSFVFPYDNWQLFSGLVDFVYDGTDWMIVGTSNQSISPIYHQDFTINSLNISADGNTTYTVVLDSASWRILAVHIKRAWPLDNWANGALVNIIQWDQVDSQTVSLCLSTTSAQNYGVIIRVIYYGYIIEW